MNQKRILTMAVIALVACGSADAQNVLGRLAERAKSAAENAVSNKIENAISGAIDNVGNEQGKKLFHSYFLLILFRQRLLELLNRRHII